MKKRTWKRLAASALALSLALTPAASAITVDEARDLLRQYYIDPVPEEILALPTIDEITTALGDPYTYYMSAEEYQTFQSDLNDAAVVGIGVMVEKMVDGLRVMQVAADSPAQKAGVRVEDLIVGVDGTTLAEVGTSDALAALIAGETGTEVTITIRRDGETQDLKMARAEVVFPVVSGELVDGHIAQLTVTSFGLNTGDYFEEYIAEEDEAADHWIVDLRGNPGGYATAAISSLGAMLGNNPVAYIADNQNNVLTWQPNPYAPTTLGVVNEPIIVITDGQSASASELFAAAMRDYGYGLVIGTRTFGKGIAQNVFEQEDGSAMKITTDRYYSPEYVTPDKSGVLPHLVVDPNLADEVALLLSGEAVEKPGSDVLVLQFLYEKRTAETPADAEAEPQKWYVHKDQATSKEYRDAFSQLLAAFQPGAVLTLNGKSVTPAEVSKAWGVDYESRYFDDVAGSPYEREINTLAALGLIQGNEAGDFDPSGELTRAELAAFLTQAMGYWCWSTQAGAPFSDVADDAWYKTAVDILYNLGMVEGNDQGMFAPDALIDHQQFLTILLRAGARADLSINEHMEKAATSDVVDAQTAGWASWSARSAVVGSQLRAKNLPGEDGLLLAPLADTDPTAITTREEAAAMLYRLLAYTGILTPTAG